MTEPTVIDPKAERPKLEAVEGPLRPAALAWAYEQIEARVAHGLAVRAAHDMRALTLLGVVAAFAAGLITAAGVVQPPALKIAAMVAAVAMVVPALLLVPVLVPRAYPVQGVEPSVVHRPGDLARTEGESEADAAQALAQMQIEIIAFKHRDIWLTKRNNELRARWFERALAAFSLTVIGFVLASALHLITALV